MKRIIQLVLFVLIVALGYLLVESILSPIRFKKEQIKRYDAVVQNLKDIRTAQNAFKDVYGRYTGSFDTLITFVKTDSIPVVFKKGEIPEEMLGKMTEKEAIAQGIIVRDTNYVTVLDSLFGAQYPIDSLSLIPYSQSKKFTMAAGEVVTGSKLKVKVFEAKAPSKYILHDLDKQQVVNLNDGLDYPGLKVGSLTEPNTAGNWE